MDTIIAFIKEYKLQIEPITTNLDDLNQPYSCNQWGNRHVQVGDDEAIITADSGYTMFNWFNTGNAFPSVVFLDHTMTVDYMANFPGGSNGGINRINNLLSEIFRDDELCKNRIILEIKLHQSTYAGKVK